MTKVIFYEDISSTQVVARDLVSKNIETEDIILVAKKMTAGIGRQNRQWNCDTVGNFATTFCIRQPIQKSLLIMPLLVGISLLEALDLYEDKDCKLKWPNDLMCYDSKFGGILTEHQNDYFLIGVGINILHTPVVEDRLVTSLNAVNKVPNSCNNINKQSLIDLSNKIYINIINNINILLLDKNIVINKWREKNYNINKNISFNSSKGIVSGVMTGIDDDGSILIKIQNTTEKFSFGEVI